MKLFLISSILLSQFSAIGFATERLEVFKSGTSQVSSSETEKLKVRIELDPNPTDQKSQPATITLTNIGQETVPSSGWRLFFNGRSLKSTNEKVATIRLFNGDLHYLTPGSVFPSLKPGASAKVQVSLEGVRNLTDFPAGFYLVYDKSPEKGWPANLEVETGNYFAKTDQQLTARIFDQNEQIVNIPEKQLKKIFPTPLSYLERGSPFTLTSEVRIVTDNDFKKEAQELARALKTIVGKEPIIQNQETRNAITFKKASAIQPEGYELSIDQDGILISASNAAGAFYGIQSLKTLLPPKAVSTSIEITGMEVKDAPRFGYRGFMMDVSRNFQPKSEVLKVLDVMALYKMNVFHFHFSDDEGWRLEIPSLPELTTVGATRAHTTDYQNSISPSYGSGPDAQNTAGTGFYSKADFVEILKYARDRHITVIPEIESPGHARAAIKAMDARYRRVLQEGNRAEAERYILRDLKDKSVYRSIQGWDDNVMDVSQPSTYAFLERVVDDLREMYREAGAPLNTIHFGGDEVPEGVWEKSPAVQNLIAKNPQVKTTDDLWYYYFSKVNQMLKARNLYLSGWEEIGLKKVIENGRVNWVTNPAFAKENFQVNVWKNNPGSGAEDLAYRMANAGYKVILTGVTHLYLDLAYNTSSTEAGQYWGGYVDIDKPFYFIPYDYLRNLKDDQGKTLEPGMIKSREALTAKGKANIVGIEAPLWSETNRSPEQFEYKMLPKLLGVAERAWAPDPLWATETNPAKSAVLYKTAWSEFISTVGKKELPRLDSYAGGFQYRIPTAGAKIINGQVSANVQFPGMIIRYTTDGSEPTPQSKVYKGPIAAGGVVKLKVFNMSGRSGQTVTIENKK